MNLKELARALDEIKPKEILSTKLDIRDYLISLGYAKRTATNFTYANAFHCPSPPTYRVVIEEWVRRRRQKRRFVTPRQRTALLLRRQGLSFATVAQRMNSDLGTVFRLVRT